MHKCICNIFPLICTIRAFYCLFMFSGVILLVNLHKKDGLIFMLYLGINLKDSIHIEKVYSIHYFEYMNDFSFPGESHNFWEFIYVDKGEVNITAGKNSYILKKGDVIFHEPNEFHDVEANGVIAPNLIVISFSCKNEAINFFKKKQFKIDETERNLLADIIIETRHCLDCRLDDPYLPNPPKKEEELFGAEQMIRNHLEHFLIHLYRRYTSPIALQKSLDKTSPLKMTKSKSDSEIFNRVANYLEQRICTQVSIEEICKDNLVGRSQLQKIFRIQTGLGIIEYFSHMKIENAKELIRTNHMNFTQISEYLGYSSIHYFSRQFKKITGMTPSEYASSIKAMAEGKF